MFLKKQEFGVYVVLFQNGKFLTIEWDCEKLQSSCRMKKQQHKIKKLLTNRSDYDRISKLLATEKVAKNKSKKVLDN